MKNIVSGGSTAPPYAISLEADVNKMWTDVVRHVVVTLNEEIVGIWSTWVVSILARTRGEIQMLLKVFETHC